MKRGTMLGRDGEAAGAACAALPHGAARLGRKGAARQGAAKPSLARQGKAGEARSGEAGMDRAAENGMDRPGWARHGRHGVARQGWDGLGLAWTGAAGRARSGLTRLGLAMRGFAGQARIGAGGRGVAQHGRRCPDRQGLAGQCTDGLGWAGVARHGPDRCGAERQARPGVDRDGPAWRGNAGAARHGPARRGSARQGRRGNIFNEAAPPHTTHNTTHPHNTTHTQEQNQMPFVTLTTPYTPREESRPEFTPIPKGWYNAEISGAGLSERNGAEIVNLSFRILDGQYGGRMIFADRYLLTPQGAPNEDTEKAVRNMVTDLGLAFEGSFRELCEALPDLIGRDLDISVGVTKPRDGHPARNRVYDTAKAWTRAKRSGTETSAQAQTPAAPPVAPANMGDDPMPF